MLCDLEIGSEDTNAGEQQELTKGTGLTDKAIEDKIATLVREGAQ